MKLDISRRKAWEPFQDHSHITTELVFPPIPILHDRLNSNSYQHYCWYMDVPRILRTPLLSEFHLVQVLDDVRHLHTR